VSQPHSLQVRPLPAEGRYPQPW